MDYPWTVIPIGLAGEHAGFTDVYEAVRYASICEKGTTIRHGLHRVYQTGVDGDPCESFDDAVSVIIERTPELGWK